MGKLIPTKWVIRESVNSKFGTVWIDYSIFRDNFSVRRRENQCLSVKGQWSDEPSPSNRSDKFISKHRFKTLESAKSCAEEFSDME